MDNAHLHIVSFQVPDPPDYGGVIDVYYKIKALTAAGVQVHLHCYQYDRKQSDALASMCYSVDYYPRSSMWKAFFSKRPMIVQSRNADLLRKNLLADNFPVLYEGLHTTAVLPQMHAAGKLGIVRMHNNEPQYYADLAKREIAFFKRLYFTEESRRLARYEKVLANADAICCISPSETDAYRQQWDNVIHVPAFHGNSAVNSATGKGDFILYHGNLQVNENVEAALFILQQVCPFIQAPVIIAGAHPDPRIVEAAQDLTHVTILANPDHAQLQSLIRAAHMHFLPAFQETGIKLKLLNALFNGRFCMVTRQMVEGTGLEPYCLIAHTADDAIHAIKSYMDVPFTDDDVAFRRSITQLYDDTASAQIVLQLIKQAPAQ